MSFITNLTSTPSTGSYLNGSPSGAQNDYGVIQNAGTVAASSFGTVSVGSDGNLSKTTIVSGTSGVGGAKPSHTFNGGTEIQMKATSSVAGSQENSILFGGSDSANTNKSINQLSQQNITYYKTAIRTNKWNELAGTWDAGYPVVSATGAFSISDEVDEAAVLSVSGTDVAANPTSAVPGKLVYMQGNPVPKSDSYKARNLE